VCTTACERNLSEGDFSELLKSDPVPPSVFAMRRAWYAASSREISGETWS
jgi:hypothetical protein